MTDPNSTQITQAFDGFMNAFEAFRETNDARLQELEQKSSDDVLLREKLSRIDSALDGYKSTIDSLTLKASRPALGSSNKGQISPQALEHKMAFDRYVRSGEATNLKRLEAKSLTAGVAADGGYLVPSETENEILSRMQILSPIRALASVRQVSSSSFARPVSATAASTGWVGETSSRTETDAQTLSELTFPVAELYAMPAASQSLLDDAAINVDSWIADEVEQAFAEQESAAFVTGNGTNKPKGFLDYTKVADSSCEWEKVGYIASGADGAFAASNPSDQIIELIYALKAGYRQNASFVMNRKTQSILRRFKDSTGNYLWAPPSNAAGNASFMNFPVVESEDMPNIASNSYSIAFGDFKRGYLVVDRQGVRILRDPYSAKPYVLFYTTKRVGGGIQDFAAIKLLKFAAS